MASQVFVRSLRGGHLAIDIDAADTVASLAKKISLREKVPVSTFSLSVDGRVLSDGRLFDAVGERGNMQHIIVHMNGRLRGGFPISVKLISGVTIDVDVDEDDDVEALRTRIREHIGISESQQRFIFAGSRLENGRSLRSYHIGNFSTVHQVRRLLGGTGLPVTFMSVQTEETLLQFFADKYLKQYDAPESYQSIGDIINTIARNTSTPAEQIVVQHHAESEKLRDLFPEAADHIVKVAFLDPLKTSVHIANVPPTVALDIIFDRKQTVADIKAKVLEAIRLPIRRQILKISGKVLLDSTTLDDCLFLKGFQYALELDEFPNTMNVVVRGTRSAINLNESDQSVNGLVELIARRERLPPESIVLLSDGNRLDNDRPLMEYKPATVEVLITTLSQRPKLLVETGASLANGINIADLTLEQVILGNGSNGEVCRGRLRDAPVAVKRLFVEQGGVYGILSAEEEAAAQANIRRECEVLGALRSPYLTTYWGCVFDETGRVSMIVMELLEPVSLVTAAADAKTVCHDVASGLLYLHDHDIVHRDVKLSNILMATVLEGQETRRVYKLSDFGEAQLLRGRLSATYTMRGTPLYLAPEVWIAGSEIKCAIDVFAFGVTVLEIITCRMANPGAQARFVPTGAGPPRLEVVPEVERRADDLARMVDEEHAHTKAMIIRSLAMTAAERPTAHDWVQHFT